MIQTRSGRRAEVPSNDAVANVQQATVTQSTLPALIQWERLPSIIQKAVLEELAQDYDRHSSADRRRRASYAAVSLQWQKFFEKLNFNKLILHDSALKGFGEIVKRRIPGTKSGKKRWQKYKTATDTSMPRIRHIWLCVELLPYDCRRCMLPEGAKEVVR